MLPTLFRGTGIGRVFAGLAVLMALSAVAPAEAYRQQPMEQLAARKVVLNFIDHLRQVMANAGQLDYQARFDALYPVVRRTYNIPVMARASLGPNWIRLNAVQRANFVDFYRRLTVARYAHRLDRPYPVTLHVEKVRLGPGRTLRVDTHMKVPTGQSNPQMDFLLRRYAGEWKVIDVILPGGLSELATRRAEYTTVLTRKGYQSLMAKMYVRTRDLGIDVPRPPSISQNTTDANR